ncbi:DUF559 domain-containing protein [Lacisediminihabitans changchengi]|uniref:DUF559 domain-containing protein n=1 Tax=Lacisediminihabitans changchengi TaxID=2787634 RepID=A0A934SIB7_9MICO|nr:DUF559 domain-containing protein [Lacisediminihabitans changchengi]MBK4347181.1 DUF559 domain-containing protein [Lacisediminihabitans changchengi]
MTESDIQPFRVRDAIAAGVEANDLRGRRWNRTVHSIRSTEPDLDFIARCRLFALRMPPTAAFSHSTAAQLLGFPVPWRLERSSDLHIVIPAPARGPHATHIRGHRLSLRDQDILAQEGLRMTAPPRTWCDLASQLSVHELVAVGDHLIHWRLPIVTTAELSDAVTHFPGRRGLPRMRAALPLLDAHAESPPESILRVIIAHGGLPTPSINHVLVQTDDGPAIRPDFTFVEQKLILEYQGDYHRPKEQWRKDMTRRTRLEGKGWRVMEINWDDLKDPTELVARIREHLNLPRPR